jgi:hypothetical protein
MAVIAVTIDRNVSNNNGVVAFTWTPLTFTGLDSGAAVRFADYSDKTFQVLGTFGASGAIVFEGSNDGTNWATLSNRQGSVTAVTAAGLFTSQDRAIWVRPRVTAGDATTSLTVVCAAHRTDLSGPG